MSTEDEKKILCQLFSKLYIPEIIDDDKVRTLKLLMYNLHSVSISPPFTAEGILTSSDV
jgi:condensin complex subunit 3